MITKIHLNKVASYTTSATLETDKKVNLIYGLNGTGKSTFSNYLHKKMDDRYKCCSIEGLTDDHDLLVYNQSFIQENFFEDDSLKGIFTLSKENKEAETKIANALEEIKKLQSNRDIKAKELDTEKKSLNKKLDIAKETLWKIKTDYSGGDRVLEFCLDGYKGSKDNLFNHVIALPKPSVKPLKNISDLKNDLQSISGDNAEKYIELLHIDFSYQNTQTKNLLDKQIVGNEHSSVSQLIKHLGNSDWVKQGLQYIPQETENSTCPFCQEDTISKALLDSIRDYFDASYEADITALKEFLKVYSDGIQNLPSKSVLESNPRLEDYRRDFEIKFAAFTKVLENNKKLIEEKIKTPSVSISLADSSKLLEELNEIIGRINLSIREHNKNIDQKDIVKSNIKKVFWDIMRWDYDQTVSSINADKSTSQIKIHSLETSLKVNSESIATQHAIISEEQKQTVNIESAIEKIRNGLNDLGITDFEIKKHSENLYKIVRRENEDKVFHSLSEGEKMIISFLYFLELCRGKKEATDAGKRKVVVIDDPISSLSHIYVFNIGRLIKNEFLGKKKTSTDKETGEQKIELEYNYEQVFILTHSLYFFYEMTETNHDFRKESQNLFRLIKNENGSRFIPMKYEEVQNDYQAYWFIIKDEEQHPSLIANCMRNIIEYFFNFVEKKDLNNYFQQEPLKANKFQAFYRYINRESHSLGQNIFDIKEFNYQDFRDAFRELFKVSGYEEHYKKMIRK
ncbi:AAA family ATPase [Flavobacterium sp. MAH-1]|uniref:AAA family ATPase n=1 Tax=Flavobacterium agri TaxID=2743471 RepID=A0A7Y9C6T5_9FLAO|nr:AAA family ATPase [Flavobacterium agri]NUY81740.1 AAA family ATPase [Flavobacterium agri]NYA71764.1 AAA family ATPase [Flavobacterium agri]